MGTPTSETDTTIEALLQQRAQYEQWLTRLDTASDKAPPAVRQRVRSDYEARLKGVIDELRGHSATISGELERHRAAQAELDRRAPAGRRGAGRSGSAARRGRVYGGRVAPDQRREPVKSGAPPAGAGKCGRGDFPPRRGAIADRRHSEAARAAAAPSATGSQGGSGRHGGRAACRGAGARDRA